MLILAIFIASISRFASSCACSNIRSRIPTTSFCSSLNVLLFCKIADEWDRLWFFVVSLCFNSNVSTRSIKSFFNFIIWRRNASASIRYLSRTHLYSYSKNNLCKELKLDKRKRKPMRKNGTHRTIVRTCSSFSWLFTNFDISSLWPAINIVFFFVFLFSLASSLFTHSLLFAFNFFKAYCGKWQQPSTFYLFHQKLSQWRPV